MSSPFDLFRTNKNLWMAGLVLLAILAFIVAPAIDGLMEYNRSNGDPGNSVMLRWADGKLTSGTVDHVRMRHARSVRFLQALAREVIRNGGMPQVPGFRYEPTKKVVEDLGLPMLNTSQAVCQTLIIAERAKQLGIEFDKPVIDDYFKRFCDRKISPQRFDELLHETAGRDLPISELYRQLSLELSAVVMERIALAGVNFEGMPLVTPGSLWQNYLRLNQSARVEAYPVLTREFVKQVKETPSESEIRALYEAGANNFPSPNSPEPGFRRRYQADIEYVSSSWNKLIDSEKEKFTEEQLKAEYDRLVALGGLKVPVESPAGDPTNEPTAAQPEEGQSPAPPGSDGKPATDSQPDSAPTTPSDPPSDKPADNKPADEKPADEKPADEKPADEKPAGEKPADEKPADASADDAGQGNAKSETEPAAEAPATDDPKKSQSNNLRRAQSGVRLVAFQESGDDLPPAVPNPPAPGETTPPETATTSDTALPDANVGASAPPPPANETPMRTQTFEEAKDSVARSLAMNVVRELLEAKMAKIEDAMKSYSADVALEQVNAENGRPSEKKVTPIDLKKLAEEHGLTYGSTGLIDGFRLMSTPIGRSTIENQPLANTVMQPGIPLYTPVRSMFIDMESATNFDFQEFLSWKSEAEAAYTPALTAIRDEVIEAWKVQRARVLAKDEAQKLADKLKAAGEDPWKSTLDAEQQTLVISPPPFTWMSAPREMFAPAQITFVQGLDTVGQEFMQQVFTASPGQMLVAPNEGLNTYYVVRLVEMSPTLDQLQQNFEISRGRARQLAFSERERMFSEWYRNIERMLNVQWMVSEESQMQ